MAKNTTKKIDLPGRIKYTSVKDAVKAVKKTMWELHADTHGKMLRGSK